MAPPLDVKQNVPGNITRDPVRNATLAFPGQLGQLPHTPRPLDLVLSEAKSGKVKVIEEYEGVGQAVPERLEWHI
jgi:hypothetical protein